MSTRRSRIVWRYAIVTVVCVLPMTESFAQNGRRCLAIVKARTPATENPNAVLRQGERWGPVTQVRINKQTGAMSYCARGDYCYKSNNIEVVSCMFNSLPIFNSLIDDGEWVYEVR